MVKTIQITNNFGTREGYLSGKYVDYMEKSETELKRKVLPNRRYAIPQFRFYFLKQNKLQYKPIFERSRQAGYHPSNEFLVSEMNSSFITVRCIYFF